MKQLGIHVLAALRNYILGQISRLEILEQFNAWSDNELMRCLDQLDSATPIHAKDYPEAIKIFDQALEIVASHRGVENDRETH